MSEESFPSGDEERIRSKAYELWRAEGEPHGRADLHWTMAREMVAVEDSFETTLLPVTDGEPVEPALALDNQGDFPGLADQGEESPHAPHETEINAPATHRREKMARGARR